MDTDKSVGTLLREARLAKGISLSEAENGTSIRARYLEALERDEYDKTPGEVFLKGMLRNYGNFLGLNGPELVQLYKARAAGMPKEAAASTGIREVEKVKLNIQLKNPRDIGSGTGRLELPSLPSLPSLNMKQALAGMGVLLVLVCGYFAVPKAIDYFKNMPQPAAQEAKQGAQKAKPAVVWDKVQVKMEATDSCWLEVHADGKEIFAGMLRAKDQKTFEAKDKLIVKYGNIGVMKLEFNGEVIDLQGEHGVQVKTYSLHHAGSEVNKTDNSEPQAAKPTREQVQRPTAPAASGKAQPREAVTSAPQAAQPVVTPSKTAEKASAAQAPQAKEPAPVGEQAKQ